MVYQHMVERRLYIKDSSKENLLHFITRVSETADFVENELHGAIVNITYVNEDLAIIIYKREDGESSNKTVADSFRITAEVFDKDGFMHWLRENINMDAFGVQVALNIIEYGCKYKNIYPDQLAYFVSDMLPDVEMLEVAKFCDHSILDSVTLSQIKQL